MQRSNVVEALYRHTAPRYETAIAPVMRPFARDLIQAARIRPGDVVLDIGTGTGIVVRTLLGRAGRILGVDTAMPMLRIARSLLPAGTKHVTFLQCDANTLDGLGNACCDVAIASFGLGDCHPDRVFRAIARVLRPGGRLYSQEWGPYDRSGDPRAIVNDTLADYVTEAAEGLRQRFRQHLAVPRPWDTRLQDSDDYVEALAEAGFIRVKVTESRPVTVIFDAGVSQFLDYVLAWAPQQMELQAMSIADRRAFHQAATQRLAPFCDATGKLHWQPLVFRASGVRKF